MFLGILGCSSGVLLFCFLFRVQSLDCGCVLDEEVCDGFRQRAHAETDSDLLTGGDDDVDEEKEWLGEGGEGPFSFDMMREIGSSVEVVGGSVLGKEKEGVDGWWEWIAASL